MASPCTLRPGVRADKRLLLAPSPATGWGIFVLDGCRPNELIAEYSSDAVRSPADMQDAMHFLVRVSDVRCLDNQILLADPAMRPNYVARARGDRRIGLYAGRAVQPGEQLFLDGDDEPTAGAESGR